MRLRERLDTLPVRQAAEPLPPQMRHAIRALEAAIIEADIDRRDAEFAVAQWLVQDLPLAECVIIQQTAEAREMRRPPP